MAYRNFIIGKSLSVRFKKDDDKDFTIDSHIKNDNSIGEKIDTYLRKDEEEKVEIDKCLNDIFGLRAIINCPLDRKEICRTVSDNKGLKCIDSSKPKHASESQKSYKAHISTSNTRTI
jgi:ppGpp synthetase/RelA/SpoT-type nucleotidyltranferase